MPTDFVKKSLSILFKQQTNILSAAFIIMGTVLVSQLLGLVRQRLLIAIFGASNTLGVYLASTKLPDFMFQLIIAGALSTAFIPVFSDFLVKDKKHEGHKMASSLLTIGISLFLIIGAVLFIFAPFFLQIINPGSGYSPDQMMLMANLMRVILIGQLLFIVGTFFSVLLQSYNHFFIPGIAAAAYNFGMIIGILFLHSYVGIFAPALGVVIGAFIFILMQVPMVNKVGFSYTPIFSLKTPGVMTVLNLMWPRTLSIAIFQVGTLVTVGLISYLSSPGRNYVIFDLAQTLAFAPVVLFGQTIAQAAFPVLSREKDKLENFKVTFITSFKQMLYLVLPVSAIILVLRIPIVRIVFGAPNLDWDATVLTGRTLALFSISIFSQALIALVSRGFYALHNTKIPLIVGGVATIFMIGSAYLFVAYYGMGIESIALAYSLGSLFNLVVLMIFLDRRVGGFEKIPLIISLSKFFASTVLTGVALYIPIKLLDQLVFDTTRTVNLLLLTGISSVAGLSLYLFLTWFFNVKEALMFITMFKKIGNWKDILGKREDVLDTTRTNP